MIIVEIKDVLVENGFKVTEEVLDTYGVVDNIFLEQDGLLISLKNGYYGSDFKTVIRAEYKEKFEHWGVAYAEWLIDVVEQFNYTIIFTLLGMISAKEKNLLAYKKALE